MNKTEKKYKHPHELMFSSAVREKQKSLGSREYIQKLEARAHWKHKLSTEQAQFISNAESIYIATSSKNGEPYIQHRGGSKGFITVENSSALWFPDYKGKRQYISIGNLAENPACFIFVMDYKNRRRLKLWGNASVHSIDQYYSESVTNLDIERVIYFCITAIDENCRKYIKPLYAEDDISHYSLKVNE